MASIPELDGITHLLNLIAAPLALEVLDSLGRGVAMPDLLPGAPVEAIDAAVDYLRGAGCVAPACEPGGHRLILTPLGRRLFAAFERAAEFDQADGTDGTGVDA